MFDFIFILYILVNMYLGFRYGMFRRVMHVGGFFLGLLLAQALSVGFSQLLNYNTGAHPVSAHLGLYLAIALATVVFIEILGFAYSSALKFLSGLVFDRLLGVILGAAAAVLELSVLMVMFSAAASTQGPSGTGQFAVISSTQEQLSTSPTARQIRRVETFAKIFYAPVLPPDLGTYFVKTFS